MSLLPQTIPPPSTPLGKVLPDGKLVVEQNWWLFWYNLSQQVLGGGTSTGLPASALIELGGVDSDANDTDAVALQTSMASLQKVVGALGETEVDAFALRQPVSSALVLAQDDLLPDPTPAAQPAASITVGASPFTYTAPAAGQVAVTGGTVSAIALIRQGTTVATGLTVGMFPVARLDQIKVTYTVAPTMTFLPS